MESNLQDLVEKTLVVSYIFLMDHLQVESSVHNVGSQE